MVEFLIDNIFVKFGGCLFRQVIAIPMGTNCAPWLADLFLYSYESEFLDNMIRGGHRKLARSFNLCYRYIDDLIVFNKKFGDYVKEKYPSQLFIIILLLLFKHLYPRYPLKQAWSSEGPCFSNQLLKKPTHLMT